MSLQITTDRHLQLCKTAFGFGVDSHPDVDGFSHTVKIHDLFVEHLRTFKFACPSGVRSASDVLGFDVQLRGLTETTMVSFKPLTKRRNSEAYDNAFYGSFFRNLQLFGSTLSGYGFNPPAGSGESVTRHVSYSGELIAEQADVPTSVVNYDFWGLSVPIHSTAGLVYDRATVLSVDPFRLQVGSTLLYGGSWNLSFLDLVTFLLDKQVTNVSFVEGALIERVLSDVSFSSSFTGFSVRYHMSARQLGGSEHIEWDGHVVIPFTVPPRVISPSVGQTVAAWQGYACKHSYAITLAQTASSDPGPQYREYEDATSYVSACLFMSFPADPDSAVELRDGTTLANLRSRIFLDKFREAVDDSWSDLVPSSLHSSVDAYKQAEGYLGVNLLQNVVKIPDILDNVTFIRDAVKVLGRLTKRDLSIATFRDVINLATSAELRANFEWRPYVDFFTRYLPLMLSTFQQLGLHGHVVGYGSFRFKIFNDLGRDEVTLVTRTKLVMDASPSGLLSAAIGLDVLGLLPKASNLWDLIPFTFVVNWFTGVGEAMRRAEYAIFLSTIPAYFVHTYTITSPLRADELAFLKASSAGVHPAILKLYYRDFTTYNPAFKESRFNFGIPTHLPNVGILGSLLYQLVFGR